jgi:hypothetical protein
LIPAAATTALEHGLDGTRLRRLAGLVATDRPAEAWELVQALEEGGLRLRSVQDAPDILLRAAARAIVADRVDPIHAADWLSQLHCGLDAHHQGFDPFIYAASEAEDRPSEHEFFVEMVKSAAAEIVGR